MKFYNVDFKTVQYLVENNELVHIERSSLGKVPEDVNNSAFVGNFYDLRDLCEATGEFYNNEEISRALNGFDVETRSLERLP